jgi:hypothetical protein
MVSALKVEWPTCDQEPTVKFAIAVLEAVALVVAETGLLVPRLPPGAVDSATQ